MKAVRIHEFGGPEKLRLDEIPSPEPGPEEAIVRVLASALNHVDVDVREGISRMPIELPHTLGIEAVGTIEALGPGVRGGLKKGDRVLPYLFVTCGSCQFCRSGRESLCVTGLPLQRVLYGGTYAEVIRCRVSQLIAVPPELSDEEAAALQIAFGTAWHMLFTMAELQVGETLLIGSVGSGIGSAALQLAKLAGAFVIGTASSDAKLARAREFGLDVPVNYQKQDVVEEVMKATGARGADVVFEHVGGESFQRGFGSLGKDGRIVIAGGHGGEIVELDIIALFRTQKRILGSMAFNRQEVENSLELARRGSIKPVVYKSFPLERASDAMETLERREHFGKVLLRP